MTDRERRLIVSALLLFAWLSNNSGSQAVETIEAANIGIVIGERCAIYQSPDTTSDVLDSAFFGDVFFVVGRDDWFWEDRPFGDERPPWWEMILDDGRLGWMRDGGFRPQPIEYLGGAILTDSCILYDSLPFGVPVSVLRKGDEIAVRRCKLVCDNGDCRQYIQITPLDVLKFTHWIGNGTTGWMTDTAVIPSYELVWLYAGRHLSRIWGGRDWSLDDDHATAGSLFQMALDQYAGKFVRSRYRNDADRYTLHVGTTALDNLSRQATRQNEVEKAIEYQREIIRRFPSVRAAIGVAGGVAKRRIAEILWMNAEDHEGAIAVCQEIIREYPGEEISGFEWYTALDYDALNRISGIGQQASLPHDFMLDQFRQAIAAAGTDVTRAAAHTEHAKVLRRLGRYDEAIAQLTTATTIHPSAQKVLYLKRGRFTATVLDLICRIYYEDLGRPDDALRHCRDIIAQNQISQLDIAAHFFVGEILDIHDGTRGDVLAAYENFQMREKEAFLVPPRARQGWYRKSGRATGRIRSIMEFSPQKWCVGESAADLLSRPNRDSPTLNVLPAGTPIRVQYPFVVRGAAWADKTTWYKAVTDQGIIGWIEGSALVFSACDER